MRFRTVTLIPNGCTGLTNCCHAWTKFDEHGILFCKGCYEAVGYESLEADNPQHTALIAAIEGSIGKSDAEATPFEVLVEEHKKLGM